MLKRLVCLVLLLGMLCFATAALTGCGDDIKTERTIEMKDVPVGEPKPVIE